MRHVVLSFEDNEAAEEFVRKLASLLEPDVEPEGAEEVQTNWPKETMALGALLGSKARLERVFAFPTKTCTCDNGESHHGNITFGKKYGWMVHAKCGKPTTYWLAGYKKANNRGAVNGWQTVAHSARDLLAEILDNEED